MSVASDLLTRLTDLGVSARADGGTLRFKPARLVPPDVLADLRAHKVAVLSLLTAPVVAPVASPVAPVVVAHTEPQPMQHWPPGSWRKRRYASDTPGDLWTTLQRPVSWADPASRPTAGDWCGCCEGARWWRRTSRTDGGWCCSTCHPPDGLTPGAFEEVQT